MTRPGSKSHVSFGDAAQVANKMRAASPVNPHTVTKVAPFDSLAGAPFLSACTAGHQSTLRAVDVTSIRSPSGIKNVTTGGCHTVDSVTWADRPSGVRAESTRTSCRSGGVDVATKAVTADCTRVRVNRGSARPLMTCTLLSEKLSAPTKAAASAKLNNRFRSR